MAALHAYCWPGNVRELQNVVERAAILARGRLLEVGDLEIPSVVADARHAAVRGKGPDGERERIETALAESHGRVSGPEGAAEALGVPPSTLESRIRRLRIDKLAFRRRASAVGR